MTSILRSMLAAGAFSATAILGTSAARAEWACEVALCISNPAGPMAVSECVSPIRKLYSELAKGRSFPLCKSADGYVNFTRYGVDLWEECPAGTTTIRADDRDHHVSGSGSSSHQSGRLCQRFVALKDSDWFIGSSRDRGSDPIIFRMINGNRVAGRLVVEQPKRREKPQFFDYVVNGQSNRIWF